MTRSIPPLPVREVLTDLADALAENHLAILSAPPGSGKTCLVAPALVNAPWLAGKKILMLEPRRLAARAAAAFMAEQADDRVGETIGYRVRFASRVSPRTRIEVVTGGVLIRLLQEDPALEGVGLIIFDEFHERSLDMDLALALCLDVREGLREDLRLLFMSATMAVDPLATLLGDPPLIRARGRSYPVEIRHLAPRREQDTSRPGDIAANCARAVRLALTEHRGDILVFVPGRGEIRRCRRILEQEPCLPGSAPHILELHAGLDLSAQQEVLRSRAPGRRVILSTTIAETSLTIEGISVVVDSGWKRTSRFQPGRGLSGLVTVRVSRAAARQRAGRAGRLGPGVCYRLWHRGVHASLPEHDSPEISQADLAPLLLQLAYWGVRDPGELRWLTPPGTGQVAQARETLLTLGALDEKGRITEKGRSMAALPLHPRLAAMLLAAPSGGPHSLACDLAALISEPGQTGDHSDLEIQLGHLERWRQNRGPGNSGRLHRVDRLSRQLENLMCHGSGQGPVPESTGGWLSLAYPDRIARLRSGSSVSYLLASGQGACLDRHDSLRGNPFLCVADLDPNRQGGRIFTAASLSEQELETLHRKRIRCEKETRWDPAGGRIVTEEVCRLDALVLRRRTLAKPPSPELVPILLEVLIHDPDLLNWSGSREVLELRIRFLQNLYPEEEWPDFSRPTLEKGMGQWLGPWLNGISTARELGALDLGRILLEQMDHDRRERLRYEAPTRITVPSGSRIRLNYQRQGPPVLAVRPQELYGLASTPTVSNRRVPVLLHLLSPAGRPLQITDDLAGFWRHGYPEVRKEMKGRYPRHYWPEDPLNAQPTSGIRPRN